MSAEEPRAAAGAFLGSRVPPLLLYEGDWLNRHWGMLGLGLRRPTHLALRALMLALACWLPSAVLTVWEHGTASAALLSASNYFSDFAAYAQFLIGLPLFVVAEAVVSAGTRSASVEFAASGVIRARDVPRLAALHQRFGRVQRRGASDLACWALGSLLSFAVVWAALRHPGTHPPWYLSTTRVGALSPAGWWEFVVALPLLNYWWLRQVWKVALWSAYLRCISRFRLDLVATHPDCTGGIGFISGVQAQFAWLLLAYGVTNVAATIGYKIALEGAQLTSPPVWGPMAGFVVIGPLLFLLPLFMFTRHLFRAKRNAERLYRRRVMEHARLFERDVLPHAGPTPSLSGELDLSLMSHFSKLYESCQQMRVVPFDWRSVSQLVGSTFGSIATVLPALHLPTPMVAILNAAQKLFQMAAPHTH